MRRQERLAARHQATRRQQVVLPQSQVGLALTRRPAHLLERVGAHAEQDRRATGRLVVRLLVRIDVGEQLLEARVSTHREYTCSWANSTARHSCHGSNVNALVDMKLYDAATLFMFLLLVTGGGATVGSCSLPVSSVPPSVCPR